MFSGEKEELPLERRYSSLIVHQLYNYMSLEINNKALPWIVPKERQCEWNLSLLPFSKSQGTLFLQAIRDLFNFLWSKMPYWCAPIGILWHKGGFILIVYQMVSAFAVSASCVLNGPQLFLVLKLLLFLSLLNEVKLGGPR